MTKIRWLTIGDIVDMVDILIGSVHTILKSYLDHPIFSKKKVRMLQKASSESTVSLENI